MDQCHCGLNSKESFLDQSAKETLFGHKVPYSFNLQRPMIQPHFMSRPGKSCLLLGPPPSVHL